jgi:hypothetical protein
MPTGTRLTDGFKTIITFSGATGASLWEVGIAPPGADGGGPNDTTTMRNTAWRTRQPKKLKTLTPCEGTAQYDPVFFNANLAALLNINQSITVTFPDNSTLTFFGWLNEFKPNEHKEGEAPTVRFSVVPSNQDGTGAEYAPVYAAGS